MNCGALERWLDDGMPRSGDPAARAHAGTCPLCGPRLKAAEQVEALLRKPAPGAPAGFADRVLRRIAAEPDPHRLPARPAPPARRLPWWSWIGADPALPAALAVGSVLLGLVQVGSVLAKQVFHLSLPAVPVGAIETVLRAPPLRLAAAVLALLTSVLLLSYALYQSVQGVVRPSRLQR